MPKYAVGTAVPKLFHDEDNDDKIRCFSPGEVTQYNVSMKLYSIKYHKDEYEEEIERAS